ncbi:hypothetical protein Y032_0507g2694 [Ancylostoma ceylanicum]|uniref:Ig-like domain-containing protein n=1 Tax=Ancylostoma ceylanicum TaxID=53326 RepID=A0A016WT86_9BILA|nr:hypothetical protein Y032_0507g2694 [Ancylostoma ceylanicum]
MSVSGYILPILALSLQILGDSEENREVYAAVGTTIDIYCGTSKSDAQNGEWSYQKRESEPEKRVPEDVIESPMKLEFKIVRQNHSGIYSCTSSNTTIVKITLFVGELPRVPENVHVEPSVDEHEYSFLKIIWDDFDNDYDTEYVLEILNREETRKWTRVARTRNCCIMRYEHVSPARTAQVRLAAVNKYGSSNYSESEENPNNESVCPTTLAHATEAARTTIQQGFGSMESRTTSDDTPLPHSEANEVGATQRIPEDAVIRTIEETTQPIAGNHNSGKGIRGL